MTQLLIQGDTVYVALTRVKDGVDKHTSSGRPIVATTGRYGERVVYDGITYWVSAMVTIPEPREAEKAATDVFAALKAAAAAPGKPALPPHK